MVRDLSKTQMDRRDTSVLLLQLFQQHLGCYKINISCNLDLRINNKKRCIVHR